MTPEELTILKNIQDKVDLIIETFNIGRKPSWNIKSIEEQARLDVARATERYERKNKRA